MDLVQTVRKEGSRGGRTEFKWEDVKNDAQRENYLGHSLMAPVGRWQKNRDLNWYAKGDDEDSKQSEADRIKEEKRKIKEAEEDAMLAAMGLPVPQRASTNANLTPLGEKVQEADVKKALDEKAAEEPDEERETKSKHRNTKDRKDRDDDRKRRRRSRSRSRDRERRDRDRRRDRSRSRDRRRDRSRSRDRRRERDDARHRYRSRSRERRRDDRHHHHKDRPVDEKHARSRSRERHRRRSRSPYDERERRRD